MLRRVVLVRSDVSEELGASLTRATRIGELGTTLAATSNRRTLRRNTKFLRNVGRSQKTPFFRVTAVKTSNHTLYWKVEAKRQFRVGVNIRRNITEAIFENAD
jgi:hypothetical protein